MVCARALNQHAPILKCKMRNSGDDMKKSILAVVVFAVALFAQADVLYWMVSDDLAATATSGGEASFAALYASDSAVALDTRTSGDVYNAYLTDPATAFQYSGIESYKNSGATFWIEILSGDSAGYKTDAMTYSQLANYILGSGSALPSSTFNAAGFGSGSTTYNVPEPTSGLLFLVGGMLLGLRRRRQG